MRPVDKDHYTIRGRTCPVERGRRRRAEIDTIDILRALYYNGGHGHEKGAFFALLSAKI